MQVNSFATNVDRPQFNNSEKPTAQNQAAGVENGSTPRSAAPLKRVEPVIQTENAQIAKSRNPSIEPNGPQSPAERATPLEKTSDGQIKTYDRSGQNASPEAVGVNFDQAA